MKKQTCLWGSFWLFCLAFLPNAIAQNCEDILIKSEMNQIEIKNLAAPIEIVQVFDADYNLIFRCEGTDCGTEQIISNLTAGLYRVNVQFYNANWQFLCQTPTQEVIMEYIGYLSKRRIASLEPRDLLKKIGIDKK